MVENSQIRFCQYKDALNAATKQITKLKINVCDMDIKFGL